MRVYLPATVPMLRQWLAAGQAPPGPAHAVTPGLREWYREGDAEELEYAAQTAAARSCLDLLDADVDAPRRRAIVAADVDDLDVAVGGFDDRSAVTVAVPVPVARWASAFLDSLDAESVVSAAVTARPAARSGDADAAFAVDEADATELGWYAVQELEHILE